MRFRFWKRVRLLHFSMTADARPSGISQVCLWCLLPNMQNAVRTCKVVNFRIICFHVVVRLWHGVLYVNFHYVIVFCCCNGLVSIKDLNQTYIFTLSREKEYSTCSTDKR